MEDWNFLHNYCVYVYGARSWCLTHRTAFAVLLKFFIALVNKWRVLNDCADFSHVRLLVML